MAREGLADVTLESIEAAYEMVDELGAGGSAAVYLARQRSSDRDVAIKVFDLTALQDSFTAEAVETEISLLRAVLHPHIVSLVEVAQDRVSLCVVMEALSGGELFMHLKKAPITEPQAALIFAQVTSAVDHLHQLGYVHRDIKPENVLFSSEPSDTDAVVKLIDLGSAARCDADGGGVTGLASTPQYVAPEVLLSAGYNDVPATGTPYGQACDIWSLGVMLYAMLSRTLPFTSRAKGGKREEEVLRRVSP